MAFIQLESDNPKFSFLIRKNPASGMIVKQLRHGLLIGYYSKGNEPAIQLLVQGQRLTGQLRRGQGIRVQRRDPVQRGVVRQQLSR